MPQPHSGPARYPENCFFGFSARPGCPGGCISILASCFQAASVTPFWQAPRSFPFAPHQTLSAPSARSSSHSTSPAGPGRALFPDPHSSSPILGGLQSCFLSEFPTKLSCCHQLPSVFALVESTVAALFSLPSPTEGCHMPCAKSFPHMILLVGDRSRTEPRTV